MSPFPRQLAWFTVGIFSAAVAAALILLAREGAPPLKELIVFAILIAFTAHLRVTLPGGVSVSPGLFVGMAALVAFASKDSMLGAAAVCSLMLVHVNDVRRNRWGWIPFNAGLSFLSFLAAAVVLRLTQAVDITATPLAVLAMVPSALAYLVVAWTLITLSYVCEGTQRPREVLEGLVPAGIEIFPFAVLGFLVGRLYLDLGVAPLVLIFVPILIGREVFRSYIRITEARDETVHMLIRALESKDRYTAGHAERVAKYAGYIGEEMNFSPARRERLHYAALMHDIGKLVVPNQILNKPGKLTAEEFGRLRSHETVALHMLSHIDFLRPVADSGHSDNTTFDADDGARPIEPYIVMVADAYDAMTSTRSYRKALRQEVAFQELREKSGTQFHPECTAALIRAIEKRGEKHGAGHEEDIAHENAPVVGVGSAGLGDLIDAGEPHSEALAESARTTTP
jgi:HD superfamily phosphodiesterase